jgi:diguanylate cyclase (GGDEF)-like protein/PAS domain S-box-containing protein
MGITQRIDQSGATEIDWFALAVGRLDSPEKVRRLQRAFEFVQQVGAIGFFEIDVRNGVAYGSPTFFQLHGLPADRVQIGVHEWRQYVHPDDRARVEQFQMDLLRASDDRWLEYRIITTGGDVRWMATRSRIERDAAGHAVMALGVQQDITHRRKAEDDVRFIATHDVLTDLANRALFNETVRRSSAGQRADAPAGLILLDLDLFKQVNDTLGHPVGDALLKAAAGRLRALAPPEALVARLGGDEFALWLPPGCAADAEALAGCAVNMLRRPFLLMGNVVEIGASVGVALAPHDADDAEALARAADLALYAAKQAGRNDWRRFAPEMDLAARQRQHMVQDLRRALALGLLRIDYQPLVTASGHGVAGFEALVRWHRPTEGLVPPDIFIPLAEDNGLIVPIGEWVLHSAVHEAVRWPGALRVAVNLSPCQLEDGDRLLSSVTRALAESGLPANRLELEVTESGLARAGPEALHHLHRLRALGVRISIDDFGTGHSSLSRLLEFPFDCIKVDKSFVAGLGHNDKAGALVRSIATLARSLNVSAVAEGVETPEQALLARHDGFTQIQGFLISRPMAAEAIGAFLEQLPAGTAPAGDQAPALAVPVVPPPARRQGERRRARRRTPAMSEGHAP